MAMGRSGVNEGQNGVQALLFMHFAPQFQRLVPALFHETQFRVCSWALHENSM
jgi:hypothetical protein